MDHMNMTVVAVAFWLFVGTAAVTSLIADYKKRRLELEPLRLAVERGQQLDPAVVEHLMQGTRREQEGSRLDPVHLRIGGIITVASGIGVGLLSFFMNAVVPIAFYPIMGAGALVVCVGAGLLLSARVLENHRGGRVAREAGV